MIISLQSDLGRPIFNLTPISMCSLKSMGKNLQNELWACPVDTFEIVRTPASYIISRSVHGLEKRLRLHSFGPLWSISTGNQWEISESNFGTRSCTHTDTASYVQ